MLKEEVNQLSIITFQASYVITLAPYFVLTALLAYGLQLKVNFVYHASWLVGFYFAY
jgi:hypothetical protein